MKSETKTTITYVLWMSEDEAKMLSNFVQNALQANEPTEEANFRRAIWDALNPPKEG